MLDEDLAAHPNRISCRYGAGLKLRLGPQGSRPKVDLSTEDYAARADYVRTQAARPNGFRRPDENLRYAAQP